jgi:hypothetical protein
MDGASSKRIPLFDDHFRSTLALSEFFASLGHYPAVVRRINSGDVYLSKK